MDVEDVLIEPITADQESSMVDLIRRNLQDYEEAGSVLAATFRRLNNLLKVYSAEGSRFFMARDMKKGGRCIGGAGIGSLHGLAPSEGLGEIRDLVLEENYRGRGLGAHLLKRCIEEARNMGYKQLYLETTPQMEKAQKLFIRFGFRPITQAQSELRSSSELKLPCYFILEHLTEHLA